MKSWFSYGQEVNSGDLFISFANHLNCTFSNDKDIQDFIKSLCLLDFVPIAGIVPDDSMLPSESLRIFYIDPNWVDSLIDGALSIGRNCAADHAHDQVILNGLSSEGYTNSAFRRLEQYNRPIQNVSAENVRTGFLLRSQLVKGWPGIEVVCFNGNKRLNILKLTTIGDSILFCIVDGFLNKITLTEPSEGLYFGFEEEKGQLVKMLSSLKEGEIGKDIHTAQPLVFRNKEKGLLNIAEFSQNINQTLKNKNKSSQYFSSLEFAVQMIQERTQCVIEINTHNIRDNKEGD